MCEDVQGVQVSGCEDVQGVQVGGCVRMCKVCR